MLDVVQTWMNSHTSENQYGDVLFSSKTKPVLKSAKITIQSTSRELLTFHITIKSMLEDHDHCASEIQNRTYS